MSNVFAAFGFFLAGSLDGAEMFSTLADDAGDSEVQLRDLDALTPIGCILNAGPAWYGSGTRDHD
jgi:hypothetical protein